MVPWRLCIHLLGPQRCANWTYLCVDDATLDPLHFTGLIKSLEPYNDGIVFCMISKPHTYFWLIVSEYWMVDKYGTQVSTFDF